MKPSNKEPIETSKHWIQALSVIALVIVTYIDQTSVTSVNPSVYGTLFAAIVGAEIYDEIRNPRK